MKIDFSLCQDISLRYFIPENCPQLFSSGNFSANKAAQLHPRANLLRF